MKNKTVNNDGDLLLELTRTNFKLRYNNSLLGFAWVLLKPFLMFLVLYFVFASFPSNTAVRNFPIYLLSGIILFSFIYEGIVLGLNALLDKAHIILKVNFNKTIAIISSEIMAAVNLCINLAVLGLFILFNPVAATPLSLAYFFFTLLVISLGLAAVAFFTSIMLIRLRDLQYIIELIMQLLFYGSAIFYPVEQLPERFRVIFEFNPMYVLIQSARSALINGQFVLVDRVLIIALLFLLLYLAGRRYFVKRVKKVAEYF